MELSLAMSPRSGVPNVISGSLADCGFFSSFLAVNCGDAGSFANGAPVDLVSRGGNGQTGTELVVFCDCLTAGLAGRRGRLSRDEMAVHPREDAEGAWLELRALRVPGMRATSSSVMLKWPPG